MPFKITGPHGGTIIRAATPARLRRVLGSLVKRFGKVTVEHAPDPVPVKKPTRPPVPNVREQIVKWARWGVQNEPRIHYRETRPMPLTAVLPLTTDCSGFATLCYKLAGAPDPNGRGYDGLGYTGTLLDHGRRVEGPRPGDLVVYGRGTGHHVAIVVEDSVDPLTVSHGQEKGPMLIRVSEERRYQPPGVTYLSFLP